MIIQIDEHFHDYEPTQCYIDSDKLDGENNPVDKGVLDAIKKKDFSQEVHFDVDEMRAKSPSNGFWDDPGMSGGAKVKLPSGDRPDKQVKLTIYFDC